MDNNPTLRKDLIDAWKRYVNKTNTREDLMLIFDSINDDDCIQEFKTVFHKTWVQAMNDLSPTTEEKEIYRKEATQFFDEYQRMRKMQAVRVLSREHKIPFRKIGYVAAAVLLLGLIIPALYLYLKPKTNQIQYIETFTQRGEIKTITLSDQTEVTLNAESLIKYPTQFTRDVRSVELNGEALFNVTPDPVRPFIIKTENMNIKVIGTVFNVKEYTDDLISSVLVASGKVEVGLANGLVMLEQNRQIRMEKTTGNIETISVDAINYLSWTNGTLFFYRTPIKEVVKILNRQFPQVNIELAEGEYSYLLTGEYENKYLVEDILNSIGYITGLKFKKANTKYILSKP